MLLWLRRQTQLYSLRAKMEMLSQDSPGIKVKVRDLFQAQEDPSSRVKVRIIRVLTRRAISRTRERNSNVDSRELVTIITRLDTEQQSTAVHAQQASRAGLSNISRTALRDAIRASS